MLSKTDRQPFSKHFHKIRNAIENYRGNSENQTEDTYPNGYFPSSANDEIKQYQCWKSLQGSCQSKENSTDKATVLSIKVISANNQKQNKWINL